MRFIVTGGCGFIGSAVVRALAERGNRVLNIDRRRKSSPSPALQPIAGREGYARLEADVSDRTLMRAIFREFQPERVIHLAAPINDESEAVFDGEVTAAFSVLEASRTYLSKAEGAVRDEFRFVHALHPDTGAAATTPRDAARATAATMIDGWSRSHSLPVATCIADHVFGPWQHETALLPGLVQALMAGRAFPLAASGERTRDWLPLRDFADGLILAALAGQPLARYEFSIGADRRDLDIAEAACALMDAKLPAGRSWASYLKLEGDPRDAGSSALLDPTDAEQDLDWRPQGLHGGLERTLAWALQRFRPVETVPKLAAE